MNRQVILLLNSLGVPDELFIERNRKAIDNLDVKKSLYHLHNRAYELSKEKGDKSYEEIIKDMRLYFGPSR